MSKPVMTTQPKPKARKKEEALPEGVATWGKPLRTPEEMVVFLKRLKRSLSYREAKSRVQEIIEHLESK